MPPWVWRPEGVNHLTMRHVPYHGPSIVEPWLYEDLDRRRICVSLGLSHPAGAAHATIYTGFDYFDLNDQYHRSQVYKTTDEGAHGRLRSFSCCAIRL